MLEAILTAAGTIFQFDNLILIFAGATLGLTFGAIPGLGGDTALALLIPITFGMEPSSGLILLISAQGGAAFGGSIPAILLNTPGTGQNTATCFDGYPMTQQGKAGIALGASATASALGALFGVIILAILLPFARQAILLFSFPEIFMMAIMGLSVIAAVSTQSLIKGIISGGFGIALSFIGWERVNAGLRFTFGIEYLYDGIKFVPVIIGLFAIGEAIRLYLRGGTIVEVQKSNVTYFGPNGLWIGIKSVFNNFGLFLRSCILGLIVGIVPGVGGSVSNFLAYMQAVQTSKNPEKFGTGDVRGVIAPEAGNDAKDGGALLPTLAFGIPGSSGMAILMGGFIIHGVSPGRELMTNYLDLVWVVLIALILANFIASGIGLVLSPYSSIVTKISGKLLAPVIFVVSVNGAFALHEQLGDVVVAVVFGIIGYYMQRAGYSRVSVIIGLILGALMEKNYHLTLQAQGVHGFFTRPIALGLLILTFFSILYPFMSRRRKRG